MSAADTSRTASGDKSVGVIGAYRTHAEPMQVVSGPDYKRIMHFEAPPSARVPDGATSGPVVVATNGHVSNSQLVKVAVTIADNLHPVTNPAIDQEGNIYVTFSGTRGQQVPVYLFKIDTNYGGIKVVQKTTAAELTEPDNTLLNGIYLVTLTAQWRQGGVPQSKHIQFYVYRPG